MLQREGGREGGRTARGGEGAENSGHHSEDEKGNKKGRMEMGHVMGWHGMAGTHSYGMTDRDRL